MPDTRHSGLLVRHIIENKEPDQLVMVIDCDGVFCGDDTSAIEDGWGEYEVLSLNIFNGVLFAVVDANA